ncbi:MULTISPECIES: STAS domain-containing protein [Streptomyces]|uniref:STAS domain-containing protein n=1 Tax=Streptomyces TaxID=1883 RepID=UPI0008FCC9C2|nr:MULTISPECIES: STAS domain-containing protein [Streptomyces]MCH0556459.1 STAS domain-containing protein [Streptomyces sp. MUM 16J]
MSSDCPAGLPHVDDRTPAVLVLDGPVGRHGVPGPCAEVRALLEGGGVRVVVGDVRGLGPAGLAAVDLLTRLELTARRTGGRIWLGDPDPALSALLDLVGLRFQVERQIEEGEPALGVEEAVETGDPAV